MNMEPQDKSALSERDICTKFVTPSLVGAGWDLQSQLREEVTYTAGRVIVRGSQVKRGESRRADYVLYFKSVIPMPEIPHRSSGESYVASGAIPHKSRGESATGDPTVGITAATREGYKKHHTLCGELEAPEQGFSLDLSWSHYRLLMRFANVHARAFYEVEAINARWTVAELESQINSLLFERLLKSRNKKGVMALAQEGNQPRDPVDILKDPFVLEFLDLVEGHELVESKVEQALVGHMRQFLLAPPRRLASTSG